MVANQWSIFHRKRMIVLVIVEKSSPNDCTSCSLIAEVLAINYLVTGATFGSLRIQRLINIGEKGD